MTVALAAVALVLSAAPVASATPTVATARAAQAGVLDWKPCSNPEFEHWKKVDDIGLEGFECATFARPLDRSRPKGKHVTLAVVRLRATGPATEHHGTLFLNPGGPGQSGVGLSEIVYLLPESVRAGFDFVTYDPRGIGASTPALEGRGCNIPKPTRPATGTVHWRKVLAARQQQVGARQRALLRREPGPGRARRHT